MGTAKTYRWERRRRKQADKQKFAFLDIHDLVILILVFAMSRISERSKMVFGMQGAIKLVFGWMKTKSLMRITSDKTMKFR